MTAWLGKSDFVLASCDDKIKWTSKWTGQDRKITGHASQLLHLRAFIPHPKRMSISLFRRPIPLSSVPHVLSSLLKLLPAAPWRRQVDHVTRVRTTSDHCRALAMSHKPQNRKSLTFQNIYHAASKL